MTDRHGLRSASGAAGRWTTAVAAAFSTLLFGVMSVRCRSLRGIDENPAETLGDVARPRAEFRETRFDPAAAANLRAGNARADASWRVA